MHGARLSPPLLVSAGLLACVATGSASAATVTASTPTVTSSNLGTGSLDVYGPTVVTQNPTSTRDHSVTTTNLPTSEVVLQPTETTSGLRALYSTPQTTTSWVLDTWNRDVVDIDVASTGTNRAGGKWISVIGSVTSATALDISFSLLARGTFDPVQTPFGPTAPPLASFFFGPSAVTAVPGVSTNADIVALTYSANTFSSQYGTTTFTLAPGVTQPFAAYVYAGQDVSINAFELTGTTTLYGLVSTPQQQVVLGNRQFVGTEVIAPIPEAEPALILAAGLGALAALTRRRRRAGH